MASVGKAGSGPEKSIASLKGSVKLIVQFFSYAIQSILYMREIYDEKSFMKVTEYGVALQVTKDPVLREYLNKLMEQVHTLLGKGKVRQLVMVIEGIEPKIPLERWVFNVEVDERALETGRAQEGKEKSQSEIAAEIRALIKHITSANTFLPGSLPRASFDLLIYTDKNIPEPIGWEISDPRLIANPDACQLRSFSTSIHSIGTYVCYTRDAENLVP